MTFWECFIRLLPFALGIFFLFGVIYPVSMVIWYKLSGSELSVREILKQI